MADQAFNIAKGRVVELYDRIKSGGLANGAFIVVLLESAEADATLIDYNDLSTLLGAAGNTEAAFTNYARKTINAAALAALPAPDDTNNRRDLDMPDQVWTSAGGASNETLAKALICFDSDTTAGTDSNIEPLGHYDFVVTTNGEDLTLAVNASGFWRSA